MSREDWQRSVLKRILHYHNKHWGTDFSILGQCEFVYPKLRGELRWDWVCRDEMRVSEAAIEFKSLTDQELEERDRLFWQIGKKICGELSGTVSGTFELVMQVPNERVRLGGRKRGLLENELKKAILMALPALTPGAELDLTMQLGGLLQPLEIQLPHDYTLAVRYVSCDGSRLHLLVGHSWMAPSGALEGNDLRQFTKLIRKTNSQLGLARRKGISETILVITETGHSGAEADVVRKTLQRLSPIDYCHIKHIYLTNTKSIHGVNLT